VCTGQKTATGESRLLFGTTDQGKTWNELAGARAVTGGRHDGLDGDGRLVAAAALGGSDLAVALETHGCGHLQLRTSADRGRNWTTAGCLPDNSVGPLAIGGAATRIVLVTVGQKPVTYISTDRGKTWSAT
jgi:photosystem II stability/assembly factor-like uncharacterized protein